MWDELSKTGPLMETSIMKFIYETHSLKPGIYKIINTHTNRIYIGQCLSFKNRWHDHKRHLLYQSHQNKFLLNDFNKSKTELGHDDFLEFRVLEVMENSTKQERNQREEFYIHAIWDQQERCYNFKKNIQAKERSCYSKNPKETRRLIANNTQKAWNAMSEQERQKRMAPTLEARRNRKQEIAAKIKKSNCKKPIMAIHISTGEKTNFISISEASITLKIHRTMIRETLTKQRGSTKGYVFKYLSI